MHLGRFNRVHKQYSNYAELISLERARRLVHNMYNTWCRSCVEHPGERTLKRALQTVRSLVDSSLVYSLQSHCSYPYRYYGIRIYVAIVRHGNAALLSRLSSSPPPNQVPLRILPWLIGELQGGPRLAEISIITIIPSIARRICEPRWACVHVCTVHSAHQHCQLL